MKMKNDKKVKPFAFALLFLTMLRCVIPSISDVVVIQQSEFYVNSLLIVVGTLSCLFVVNEKNQKWLFVYFSLIFVWIVLSNILAGHDFAKSVIQFSKYIVPILITVNLIEMSKRMPLVRDGVVLIFVICTLVFILPLVFRERYFHGGIERLPLYYGTLHDNGFIAATVSLFSLILMYTMRHKLLGFIIFMFSIYLMMGYLVRTSMVMFTIVVLGVVFFKVPDRLRQLIFIETIVVCGVILILFLFFTDNSDEFISSLSSGRTRMWLDQINRLISSSFLEVIFGFGSNGDIIHSSVWLQKPKDAHSTLLGLLVQYGIVGFCLFVSLFIKISDYFSKVVDRVEGRCLYAGFISTLVISNGLLERVVPCLLYFLLFLLVQPKFHDLKRLNIPFR